MGLIWFWQQAGTFETGSTTLELTMDVVTDLEIEMYVVIPEEGVEVEYGY